MQSFVLFALFLNVALVHSAPVNSKLLSFFGWNQPSADVLESTHYDAGDIEQFMMAHEEEADLAEKKDGDSKKSEDLKTVESKDILQSSNHSSIFSPSTTTEASNSSSNASGSSTMAPSTTEMPSTVATSTNASASTTPLSDTTLVSPSTSTVMPEKKSDDKDLLDEPLDEANLLENVAEMSTTTAIPSTSTSTTASTTTAKMTTSTMASSTSSSPASTSPASTNNTTPRINTAGAGPGAKSNKTNGAESIFQISSLSCCLVLICCLMF